MPVRNIIRIDEDKCNGCGECITGCVEGALELVDGKAKLMRDSYCDGLGACLGDCPTGALTIEQRDADDFDEEAALAAVAARNAKEGVAAPKQPEHACPTRPGAPGGCPGSAARQFGGAGDTPVAPGAPRPSRLTHWPVQLHLISPAAPQYQGADVLVAADCVAFAHADFHEKLLAGRSLIIACPKLDDSSGYVEKLTSLFKDAKPTSVTVPRMQVPCCGGLIHMVLEARKAAGSSLPVREVVVGVEGELLEEKEH